MPFVVLVCSRGASKQSRTMRRYIRWACGISPLNKLQIFLFRVDEPCSSNESSSCFFYKSRAVSVYGRIYELQVKLWLQLNDVILMGRGFMHFWLSKRPYDMWSGDLLQGPLFLRVLGKFCGVDRYTRNWRVCAVRPEDRYTVLRDPAIDYACFPILSHVCNACFTEGGRCQYAVRLVAF